jgi:hypothetical protein
MKIADLSGVRVRIVRLPHTMGARPRTSETPAAYAFAGGQSYKQLMNNQLTTATAPSRSWLTRGALGSEDVGAGRVGMVSREKHDAARALFLIQLISPDNPGLRRRSSSGPRHST